MGISKNNFCPNWEIICDCKCPTVLRTLWTDSDHERRYHGCARNDGGCDFRLWDDPPMCYRSKMLIPELRNQCDKLEVEIPELMLIVEFLSEKMKKMQHKEYLQRRIRKNCLLVILILPVVFMILLVICG